MKTVIACCVLFLLASDVHSVEWMHSAVLDNNFLVLWTPGERDVTFEIQVKTLGYVGLGFKNDDDTVGTDMVIGWVDNNGQLHLQVSVLKRRYSRKAPISPETIGFLSTISRKVLMHRNNDVHRRSTRARNRRKRETYLIITWTKLLKTVFPPVFRSIEIIFISRTFA